MSDPFLGEIRTFGFNFAPNGWAFCSGQILSISQNTALFSLLGTYYGGNGSSTFGLPDLRSRVAIHAANGAGTGLTNYQQGQMGGVENVTLTTAQLPAHTHDISNIASQSSLSVVSSKATLQAPATGTPLARSADGSGTSLPRIYAPAGTTPDTAIAGLNIAGTLGSTGSGQAHTNVQPYLGLNCCIALQGIYPSRS